VEVIVKLLFTLIAPSFTFLISSAGTQFQGNPFFGEGQKRKNTPAMGKFCEYRQDAAKRQTVVLNLLTGQKSGFSPHRGDSFFFYVTLGLSARGGHTGSSNKYCVTVYGSILMRFSALFSESIALSDALHSSHFRC